MSETTRRPQADGEPPVARVTESWIPLSGAYGPDDLTRRGIDVEADIGSPGTYPFTRGISAEMYRDELWVMGQYSGYASPADTNKRIRELLDRGQRGFSIALDLPTQLGLDSDDVLAAGEVGKVGVPIDSLEDMIVLLDGIPLDQVRQIRTTANSIGPIVVALFVAAAEHLGYSPQQFRVMLQNDVLKEYTARGTQIFPPRHGLEFSVDVIEYCARHLPHWEPIEFCGYHIRDAGGTAVEEVAFALANGIEYIEAARRRGLRVDEFIGQTYMFLSSSIDLLEEVAKFRAARRMWARMLRDRYGVEDDRFAALNIFAYTLGGNLTAAEPLNNLTRITIEALAAVLGGVQTLATSSWDEAIGLPSADAALLSLRAQQIIAYESGVTGTADPLGGAWFLESLTSDLEERVGACLDEVQKEGGSLAAVESGWMVERIERQAYRQQQAVDSGEKVVVGSNYFGDERAGGSGAFAAQHVSPEVEAEQMERLGRVRSERDQAAVRGALAALDEAARSGSNRIPALLDAVNARATIGEMVATLKTVWGDHRS